MVLPARARHHFDDTASDQLPLLVAGLVGQEFLEIVEVHVFVLVV